MAKVTIGCRLPTGLVIEVNQHKVTLEGQRQAQERSPIILLTEDDYGITEVESSFWEAWKKQVGDDFTPLKSGAVFEAKSAREAGAKAKDMKEAPTGHEPMKQDAAGVKADK